MLSRPFRMAHALGMDAARTGPGRSLAGADKEAFIFPAPPLRLYEETAISLPNHRIPNQRSSTRHFFRLPLTIPRAMVIIDNENHYQ